MPKLKLTKTIVDAERGNSIRTARTAILGLLLKITPPLQDCTAADHQGWPSPNDQSSLSTKTMLIMMSSGRTASLVFNSSATNR
jgi:hypothetical protein